MMTTTGSGRIAFLVGAPRSGTNWLQRMLAAHPDIGATPSETMLFTNAIRPVVDAVHHGATESPRVGAMFCDRAELMRAVRQLADTLYGSLRHGLGDPPLLLERSPLHAFDVTLIREVFPEAPVIHLVRNGLDVAASLLQQPWGPESMTEAAALWRDSVLSARQLSGDPLFREVRYEGLLADPWAGVEPLLRWLGLDVDGDVEAALRAEAGTAFNVTGAGITAAKWHERLSEADVEAFGAVAGDIAAELPDVPVARQPSLAERTTRRVFAAMSGPARRLRPVLPDVDAPRFPGHELVEQFLDAIHTGRIGRLGELVEADAPIRVVADGDSSTTRGRAQLDRLASLTVPLRDAVQDRGDVHVGVSSTTVVLDYTHPELGTVSVTAVFDVPWQDARTITRLSWYQRSC